MKIVDDTDRDPEKFEKLNKTREREREKWFLFLFLFHYRQFIFAQFFQLFSFSFVDKKLKGWMDKKKKKNEEEAVFSVDRYQDQS